MNFDFELALVIFTGVAGAIWLVDSLFFLRKRTDAVLSAAAPSSGAENGMEPNGSDGNANSVDNDTAYREPVLVEYARSFFPVLLVVLVLRSFLFEPFRIPSGSMLPTLLIGDFILVNKFSYGVRLPVLHNKILDTGSPDRGDVAVFRFPDNPDVDFIKRIVALPGDTIRYRNKQLTVNGKPMPLENLGPYDPPGEEEPNGSLLKFVESFEGAPHKILVSPHSMGIRGVYATNGDYTVPEGRYFVMGDNRDNSNDSRYWGTVPEENLVGKAILIWMNLDFHWDRLGTSIE